MSVRQRVNARDQDTNGQQQQDDAQQAPPPAAAAQQRQQPRGHVQPAMLPRLILMLVATALAGFLMLAQTPELQERLPLPMQVALTRLAASSGLRQGRVFTADELAQYTSTNPAGGGKIYIAILGEVFDVSAKPEFYGTSEGYGHFAGTDGSKSFITGDFTNDVTDDVSELDAEACHGLVGWLDFYHKTYPRVGTRIGRFYDASGQPTAALGEVLAKAREGKRLQEKEEDDLVKWPNCNSKWTEKEGGKVWCEGGRYPRKLYVKMVNGRPTWRCGCFVELGWSDIRQIYPDCDPDAHSCDIKPRAENEDTNKAADEAAMRLIQSLE